MHNFKEPLTLEKSLALVDETVEHYKTHPRSIGTGKVKCLFLGPNGERCAFSRLCSDMDVEILHKFYEGKTPRCLDIEKLIGYSEKDGYVYTLLQVIHDYDDNWEKDPENPGRLRLSENGIKRVQLTKSQIGKHFED